MSLGLAQLLSSQSLPMLHDPSSAGELKPFAGLGRVVKWFPFFLGGGIFQQRLSILFLYFWMAESIGRLRLA